MELDIESSEFPPSEVWNLEQCQWQQLHNETLGCLVLPSRKICLDSVPGSRSQVPMSR
jgi:hypothetical protein